VSSARVEVDGELVGQIGQGLLVYLAAGKADGAAEVAWAAQKIEGLRVFEDELGKMNRTLGDVGGQVLLVSQFTLYGDVRKGRRPSFEAVAAPELAQELYAQVCQALRGRGFAVETGRFRAKMMVHACVAGPVTILLDSQRAF
jgi:D-tyrosyl-tRNA(Tyr) deacylase